MRQSIFFLTVTLVGAALAGPASAQHSSSGPASAAAPYKLPAFSVEKDPLVISNASGNRMTFLRTLKSTCSQYVLVSIDAPGEMGPVPHIHYADDEWFYLTEGTSTLLMQAESTRWRPGQRPGENAPAVTFHAFTLQSGQLAYGPAGMVHQYKNETKAMVRNFIHIWSPADGVVEFFQELDAAQRAAKSKEEADQALTNLSSKWGLPHSVSGSFVKEVVRTEFPHGHDNQAARLEELIRSTEHCNPNALKP